MFSSPSENGGGEGGDEGGINVPLLGVVIMSLIVIFAVYYYFSYTYNLSTSSNARYTVI
jgi:hypothetical protein